MKKVFLLAMSALLVTGAFAQTTPKKDCCKKPAKSCCKKPGNACCKKHDAAKM